MPTSEPILSTFVFGHPRPQGSKVAFANGGMREASKYVKAWREDIRDQLIREWNSRPPLSGPIRLELHFIMPRPKYLERVKLTPPAIRRPDIDKLFRAVGDAISMARIWGDDSQITDAHVTKRIAGRDQKPGVYIAIWPLEHGYMGIPPKERLDD